MSNDNNLAKAIAGSRMTHNAKYLREGRHLLQVHTAKTTTNRENRPLIVFEFTVLDTTNPEDHPVGSLATLLFFGDSVSGLKQAKTAICRILNIDESELTENIILNSLSPEEGKRFSPLRGLIVECDTSYQQTRKGGRYTLTVLYSCEQDVKSLADLPTV